MMKALRCLWGTLIVVGVAAASAVLTTASEAVPEQAGGDQGPWQGPFHCFSSSCTEAQWFSERFSPLAGDAAQVPWLRKERRPPVLRPGLMRLQRAVRRMVESPHDKKEIGVAYAKTVGRRDGPPLATFTHFDAGRGAAGFVAQRQHNITQASVNSLREACKYANSDEASDLVDLPYYSSPVQHHHKAMPSASKHFMKQFLPASVAVSRNASQPNSMQRHHFNWESHIWMGCPGVHAAAHFDSVVNVFVQLRGSKRFRLWAPEALQHMELHPRGHPSACQSKCACTAASACLPPFSPLAEVLPAGAAAAAPATRGACPQACVSAAAQRYVDLLLQPGDVLLLPPFFLHEVTSGGLPGPDCASLVRTGARWGDPQAGLLSVSLSFWGDAPAWQGIDALMYTPLPVQPPVLGGVQRQRIKCLLGQPTGCDAQVQLQQEHEGTQPTQDDISWQLSAVLQALGRLQQAVSQEWEAGTPPACGSALPLFEQAEGVPAAGPDRQGKHQLGALVDAMVGPAALPPLPEWLRLKVAHQASRLVQAAHHIQSISQGGETQAPLAREWSFQCSARSIASRKLQDYFADAQAWLTGALLEQLPGGGAHATALRPGGMFGTHDAQQLREALHAAMAAVGGEQA